MNADLAFQYAANLAAAKAGSAPAYVSYTARTHIAIPRMHREREVDCREITRTRDGMTHIVDMPNGGQRFAGQAFPISPSFNAVAAFDIHYGMSLRGVPSFQINNVHTLTYNHRDAADADAVVVSTRGYRVSFAPDSSEAVNGFRHILLEPTTAAKRRAPKDVYYFSEMVIANATGLPSRISYVGTNDFRMSFDYAMNAGNWLMTDAHIESTLAGPFGIGRVHFLAETTFSELATSATAPLPSFPAS
jgi:hypothetical protein